MNPITHIQTPFHEKFGVPRQSLIIPEAFGKMIFPKNDFFVEAFRGIEKSSHLWLIFEFHEIPEGAFNGLVRPPRFDNKFKMGVYATRSPHRPNRIGLSVVKFEKLEFTLNEVILSVSGVDLLSGSPILDIKPYVPYADSIEAFSPFNERLPCIKVNWLCEKVRESDLIEKVISLDPRPRHHKTSNEEYGVSLAGYNIRFRFLVDHFEIISVIRFE